MSEVFHIDRLANSGVEVQIAGKPFRVSQFTLRDQGVLQSLIRKLQPSPMAQTQKILRGLAPETVADLLKDARKAELFWPQPVASTEGLQILVNTEEGQRAILKAALSKAQTITDEDIDTLMDTLTIPEFMRIAGIAVSGEDPEADPKAE
jgi:hypothetical protein